MAPVRSQSHRFPRRPVRGSVILLVLLTILLAAFLLTKFVERANTELLADARASDQARLRREAYSALEATLAVIADLRSLGEGLQSPAQSLESPLDRAGYKPPSGVAVEVAVQDESAKISLPMADPDRLIGLFTALGLNKSDAARATDALLVWTRPDHLPASLDADGSVYERGVVPHLPAGRPLRSFDELAAIETVRDFFFDASGQPTALARGFAANTSLHAFARTNVNTATPAALLASGLSRGEVDTLASRRRHRDRVGGGDYFRGMNEVAAVLGAANGIDQFGTEVSAWRVLVTVRSGAAVYRLEAVVAPPNGATAPAAASLGNPPEAGLEIALPAIKALDYPFKLLEISEDVESTVSPARPADHD